MEARILKTRDAARYLAIPASTLEKRRLTGDGPPFVRLGRRAVGYDVRALDRWLNERSRASTSEPGTIGEPSASGGYRIEEPER